MPSCICGPFFEFKDFEDWIELKGSYSNLPPTLWPGIKRFLAGLLWMSFAVPLREFYNVDKLPTEEFCYLPFYVKPVRQFLAICAVMYSYFIVWAWNDGATAICGLAFNGYDEKAKKFKFDRVKNIDELNVIPGTYVK